MSMESLLKEVRASLNANDSQSSPSLISEALKSQNQRVSPALQTDGDKHATDPSEPTAEQLESLLALITELEGLRESKPDEYQAILQSLGVTTPLPENSKESVAAMLSSMRNLEEGDALRNSQTQEKLKFTMPDGKTILGKDGVENKMKGKWIHPKAGFVVQSKTLTQTPEQKVYINICTHDDIEIPSMKKRLDESGESVEGLNVPMSVGSKYEIVDPELKSGMKACVYDVVVNTSVMNDLTEDATGKYRDFICQLCIQYIESKIQQKSQPTTLDRRYSLPKAVYYGATEGNTEPARQFVQDRANIPKIEILEEKSLKPSKTNASQKQAPASLPIVEVALAYQLTWVRENGEEIAISRSEDYVDPIAEPPHADIAMMTFKAEFSSETESPCVDVSINPYRLQVKILGYKVVVANFPCLVDVPKVVYVIHPVDTHRYVVEVTLPIDFEDIDSNGPDPGSKPWLMGMALSEEGSTGQSASMYAHNRQIDQSEASRAQSDEFPEDKFHVKLPDNVDKYTGLKLDEERRAKDEESEFPEDRFHRADAASSYLISQREQAVRDKIAKHEKEKAERANDPNIEYVDVNDFKQGGKYGPRNDERDSTIPIQQSEAGLGENKPYEREELRKASAVVASAVASMMGSTPLSNAWADILE